MPSFTEETEFKIAGVEPNGVVFVRSVVNVLRDAQPFSQGAPHRTPLYPGQDVSAYPEQIQAVCAAVWTPDVVAVHEAAQAALQADAQ